jgi:hypothetical protein
MAIYPADEHGLPVTSPSPERELRLVCSSVSLVATGGARRVTHVGLGFAARILADAQAFGRTQGVNVRARPAVPRWDIVVEPIG